MQLFQHKDGLRCCFHSLLYAHKSERFFILRTAQPRSITRGRALQLEGIPHKNYKGKKRSIAFLSSCHRRQSQWRDFRSCKKANRQKNPPFARTSLATPAERLRVWKMLCCFPPSNLGHGNKMLSVYIKCPKMDDQIDTRNAMTSHELCTQLSTKTSRGCCACGTLGPNSQPL